jgi:2-polyprenyl-3-methyl-5-hydroxy-6-metoxy-1,4-benzoquinol methylase
MLLEEPREKPWNGLAMTGSSIQLALSREHRRFVRMTRTLACWCGNTSLGSFSLGYFRCPACETLVAAQMPTVQDVLVKDDERDFYGKHYFERLSKEFGQPSLQQRSRSDLAERCLYWLRELLKYKLPPARILEMGSAHGGFVAMMRWTGFDATGLDVSPGLCDFARQTFNVPILTGPVESQEIPPQSLDVIALMDVFEHLPDPVGTMRHCATLLKPDGIFFIQTPRYVEGKTLEEMESENDAFLQQLKADQHLFLFSKSSAAVFFERLGFKHVNFEPAIFSLYDMALVVGSRPLVTFTEQEATARLESQVSTRSTLALLDLDNSFQKLKAHTEEVSRAAEERLASLEAMHAHAEEIRRESEQRLMELSNARDVLQQREINVVLQAEALLKSADQEHATRSALSESLVREGALRREILDFKRETILGFVKRKIRTRKSKTDAARS